MKSVPHNFSTNQVRLFTALILTGILSVSSGLTLNKSATALPALPLPTNQVIKGNAKELPRSVKNAVIRDLARRERISIRQLEIVQYSQKNWRNGCLELARRDELCTQALVPGWRVVVSNGRQNWIYHTNSNGRNLRLVAASASQVPVNVPKSVREAVFKDASTRLRIAPSTLTIIQAQQRNWSNGCLNLPRPDEVCTQILIKGWRIVVGAPEQVLVYHTNATGSTFRLNEKESEIALPEKVSSAVLQAASQITSTTQKPRIVGFERIITNGCLNLPAPGEGCTKIALPAWKVNVAVDKFRLVYHAKNDGSDVRLNVAQSNLPNTTANLPQAIANAVLLKASQDSDLSVKALSIVGSKRTGKIWQVTVGANEKRWVYHVENNGATVKLVQRYTETQNAILPGSIREEILTDASQRARFNKFVKVTEVLRRQYPDACRGVVESDRFCPTVVLEEYQVTVSDGQQRLVYLVDERGEISFNEKASQIADSNALKPLPIPTSELPPALDQGIIFRQVSSGGFTGATYETILLNDGRLMQHRIGDSNDSSRRVWQISLQKLQEFQELLSNQGLVKFDNVIYPAPNGAADYITYTLTNKEGTIQYNDVSENNLPDNLQAIVKVWNQIKNSYQ
jgi:hypothetical protein